MSPHWKFLLSDGERFPGTADGGILLIPVLCPRFTAWSLSSPGYQEALLLVQCCKTCSGMLPAKKLPKQMIQNSIKITLGAAGIPMIPISWQEMQCPESNSIETRKVAKVDA